MNDRYHRMHAGDRGDDNRSASQRDRDRILYTSAFRRLAGVTQVVAPTERQVVHNRLTHTLEVAQIGRRVAERLIKETTSDLPSAVSEIIDPDIIEAAALAHDLGHPPFGHVAEQELDILATKQGVSDGFNGNAQSFRIITKLAIRNENFCGLNLTRATLNSVLKYPWVRTGSGLHHSKWGVYGSEKTEFAFARNQGTTADSALRTLEADVMDWADDVAFAVHDLEDFYRTGSIPLDRLRSELDQRDATQGLELQKFLDKAVASVSKRGSPFRSRAELEEAFISALDFFPLKEPYDGSFRHRAIIRGYTSSLIKRYVEGVGLQRRSDGMWSISIPADLRAQVAMLKQLTWEYVIHNPALATQQFGQRRVIKDLCETLVDASKHEDQWYVFPHGYQERLKGLSDNGRCLSMIDMTETWDNEGEGNVRLVIDFITSMTEQQTIDLHQRLTGASRGSALDSML